METTELVTRAQEHQTAASLYGDDADLAELFEAVKKVAPWANDKQYPMNNAEIGLAIRRSAAMGLDPLNQHEVQIWKDKRGTVNFQLSYTLIAEWVRHFHGEHTEPQYHRLGSEELAAEGLQDNDMAFSVTFLMKKDIASLSTLVEAGYDARQARSMLEIGGLGVARASEAAGQYFAPAGRSPAWKVKKRALTDACRRKFGTPTRSDIEELRRAGGMANVKPQDWSDVQELSPHDAAALAKDTAMHREHQEQLTADPEYKAEFDETVKAAESLMYPAPEPQTVDAEFTEVPEEPIIEEKPTAAAPKLRNTPAQLRDKMHANIEVNRSKGFEYSDPEHPLGNYQKAIISNLEGGCFAGDVDALDKRHAVTWYLTGKESTLDLDAAETVVLHKWLNATKGDDGQWSVNVGACREAHAVYAEAMREMGQAGLFDEENVNDGDDPERPF